MAERPYLIAAPAYNHHSAGIRVLHTLCSELNRCGHNAHLIFYRFRPEGGATFYPSDADDHYGPESATIPRLPAGMDMERLVRLVNESIVVYPEVIQGNPLQARRVVRYVLNSPESNKYPMLQGKDDFIVTFHPRYISPVHAHLLLLIAEPLFHDCDTRPAAGRTLDCTYIGKGEDFAPCFKVPGTLLVERTWPRDKESLACILRNTRYFFTWDLVTQTNTDAIRCGAIPVVMRWAPFSQDVMQGDFGEIPHAEAVLQNDRLVVRHDPAAYAATRRTFLDNYARLVDGNSERTEQVARQIAQYFNR